MYSGSDCTGTGPDLRASAAGIQPGAASSRATAPCDPAGIQPGAPVPCGTLPCGTPPCGTPPSGRFPWTIEPCGPAWPAPAPAPAAPAAVADGVDWPVGAVCTVG